MNYMNYLHYLNREPGFRFTAEKSGNPVFAVFRFSGLQLSDARWTFDRCRVMHKRAGESVQAKSSKKSLDKLFKHRYNNKAVQREGLKPPGSTCSYAAIAQPVERILGKDEVPGSNPGSSSMKNPTLSL